MFVCEGHANVGAIAWKVSAKDRERFHCMQVREEDAEEVAPAN